MTLFHIVLMFFLQSLLLLECCLVLQARIWHPLSSDCPKTLQKTSAA